MVAKHHTHPLRLLTQEARSHHNSIAATGEPHHTIGILGGADSEHILHIFAFAVQGLRAKIWRY